MPLGTFALLWAVIFSGPLTVWQLIRKGGGRIPRTIASVVLIIPLFLVLMFVYSLAQPSFVAWLEPGWWLAPIVGLLITAGWSAALDASAYEQDWQWLGTTVVLVLFVLTFFIPIVGHLAVPPTQWRGIPICDESGTQQMVNLLPVHQAPLDSLPNANLDTVVKVTPDTALQKASQLLPRGLGSYAQPDRAYLQLINGDPYYIVDLKVTDQKAFDENGDTIPGYVLVSATDTSSNGARFVSGYHIHLAPSAGWPMNQDLERWVYWNYTRTQDGYGYEVSDISGMQVDASGRPFFTGTIMQPVVGVRGFKPVGMIVIDPQTESFKTYPLDKAPDFAYIRYPESYMFDLASKWWALYSAHNPCHVDRLNELTVDSQSYQVVDKGKAVYVFTYTSIGVDNSLSGELVVDPTTGLVTNYQVTGATQSRVTSVVNNALAKNPAKPTAQQCQLMRVESRMVWYCIATLNNNTYGYAMLQTSHTTDTSKVILEPDMNLLLSDLQKQIAEDGVSSNPNLTVETKDLTFTGTVTNKASTAVSNGSITSWIPFTMEGSNIPSYAVFYGPINDTVALMRVGDNVTVKVHANVLSNGQLQSGVPLFVFQITDNTQPNLGS